MEAILNILTEFGAALIEPVAVFATAAIVFYARKHFNISIDEKMRGALHGAIERGIEAASNHVGKQAKEAAGNIEIRSRVLGKAVDYVGEYSPDVLKHFDLTPERLANLVSDRLPAFDSEILKQK